MESFATIRVLLLALEWRSKPAWLSSFIRELAIQLAKQPQVLVSVLVPRYKKEEKIEAESNNVTLVQATKLLGFDEIELLSFPPENLQIDFVVGSGGLLGPQALAIRKSLQCKCIQFVHTDPEELGMFKKHQAEVELCRKADCVVAVGPKLAEAYRSYLRCCGKDQDVFILTPGILSEFSDVVQSNLEGKICRVLAFGRGDPEDFSLKRLDGAVGQLLNGHLIFASAQEKHPNEVVGRFKDCGIPPNRLRIRTFMETREELKHLFCEVDIAIMPSRTEGFGLVALEAMSAGLPVLVSANSGLAMALMTVDGWRYVVDSEDPEVWAKRIKEIWDQDRETRLKQAQAVYQKYGQKYSWAKQCGHLVERMEEILIEAPPAELKRKELKRKSSFYKEDISLKTEESEGEREVPRVGSPSNDALEWLSLKIGKSWMTLARRLNFDTGDIVGFQKSSKNYADRAFAMLLQWKQRGGLDATYKVLFNALRHELVNRADLAETLLL